MYEKLDQFPKELLFDIFNLLAPETLLTLREGNKTLNVVATDVLFRQKNAQALAYQKAWLDNIDIHPNLTDVNIDPAIVLTAIQNPEISAAVRLKGLAYLASRNKIEFSIKEESINVLIKRLYPVHNTTETEAVRESSLQMLAQIIPILTDNLSLRVLTQVINNSLNEFWWGNNNPKGLNTVKIILPKITSKLIINQLFKVIDNRLSAKLTDYQHHKWLDILHLIGPQLSPEQISLVLERVKDKFLNHISPYLRKSAFKLLAAIVTKFTPEQRKIALEKVMANLDNTKISDGVIRALSALVPKLSLGQVALFLKKLLDKQYDEEASTRGLRSKALVAIFPRLNKKQIKLVMGDLTASLNNQDKHVRCHTLKALPAMVTKLSQAHISTLLEPILANLQHEESSIYNAALGALKAIVPRIPFEQISDTYEQLMGKLLEADIILEIDGLLRAFTALSPRLSQEQSTVILELLIVKLNEEEGLISIAVRDTFTAVSSNLSPSEVEVLLIRLTDRLKDDDLEIVSNNLAAIAAIITQLTPKQARSTLDQALSTLDTYDFSVREEALKLLMAGASQLSHDQVESSLKKLINILDNKLGCIRRLALQTLNIMIPKLNPGQIKLVLKKSIGHLTDCELEVREQATRLLSCIIVSEKYPLNQLEKYSEEFSKSIPLQIITDCYTQIKTLHGEQQDSKNFPDGIKFFDRHHKFSISSANQLQTRMGTGI